jgi:hypothetical protein
MNSGQAIIPSEFLTGDEREVESAGTSTQKSTGDLGSGLRYDPDLWLNRERTIALLKRYLRISIEVGRLPSLLGRELFRSKVTSYRMSSFEDAVIFEHEVERALDQVDTFGPDMVAVNVFQAYSQAEPAEELQ